jgi:hypothetical protein
VKSPNWSISPTGKKLVVAVIDSGQGMVERCLRSLATGPGFTGTSPA